MAPSIISHFRPHRRVGSTPTSPQPTQQFHTAAAPSPSNRSVSRFDSPSAAGPTVQQAQASSISTGPPILPPITRVSSQHDARRASIPEETGSDDEASAPAAVQRRPVSSNTRASASVSPVSYVLPPIRRVTSLHEQDSPDTPTPVSATDDILEEKSKLSEPSMAQHPERLSERLAATSASFADFGRMQTASSLAESTQTTKPPQTPSNKSQAQQGHNASLLYPQAHNAASPASSVSSFHKTSSSTNLAVESSPASSRSAHGSAERGPAPGNRLSRSKLNLLNPVSLLKRRRTSQALEPTSESSTIPARSMDLPIMGLSPDYDPRIRGKGVHNFDDAPRPRRNYSTNDMAGMAAQAGHGGADTAKRRSSIPALDVPFQDDQPLAPEKAHTPVFVENFEEEEPDDQGQGVSAVQRETLANSQFLARMSKQMDFDSLKFSAPFAHSRAPPSDASVTPPATAPTAPPPAQAVPQIAHQDPHSPPKHNARASGNTDVVSLRISSDQSTARSSMSNETKATSPPQSPTADVRQFQARSLDPSMQYSPNLSHLPSTASRVSRFSFQLNSDRSIEQEKALEEKHKQKHDTRDSKRDSRFEEFDEDGIDYDELLDDGGYEEDIPTMGGDEEVSPMGVGLGDKRLSSFNTVGQNLAPDVTRASSSSHYGDSLAEVSDPGPVSNAAAIQGLGLQNTALPSSQPEAEHARPSDLGDEMYFDDGVIDEFGAAGGSTVFDESMLDSPVRSKNDEEAPTDEFPTPRHRPAASTEPDASSWDPPPHNEDTQGERPQAGPEEKTPTKSVIARSSEQSQQEESTPKTESGLNAYHSALAEAASRAARDGKFTRQNSIMSTSSTYSSNAPTIEGAAGDPFMNAQAQMAGSRQAYEDDGADVDDDLFIAEANADALNSEDSDFYGQEFGFYRNPNASSDGNLYNGGYFGQPSLLGASLRNREPAMTPITERSEYSTRNSVVCGTPWGPPSAGPWGSASSANQHNVSSPGLKDIAASMGMNDEEMTLGQLLRLRREAFGSAMGSGPQSAHVSSSSNESSPTSQHNPSPLASRSHSGSAVAGMAHGYEGHSRRPSEPELAKVQEAPEHVESGEDSPISENVTLGTARAVLFNARAQKRRSSADLLAQEYTSVINPESSPVPVIAEPIRPTPPTSPSQQGFGFSDIPGPSTPPILASPKPQRASMNSTTPAPKASSPLSSPPVGNPDSPQLNALPSPPMAMMQKFAQRPAPDAYRKAGPASDMPQHRRQSSGDGNVTGTTSVAYVREVDEDGVEKWFLEKRKRKSTGELLVIGREPVESGRI